MPPNLQYLLVDGAMRALSSIGVANMMAPFHAGIGAILAFHRIHRPAAGEFASQRISVPAEIFQSVIETLLAKNYNFVTMSRLIEVLAGRTATDAKVVCLTFDDGYADTYTAAFAICRKYRVPMTVYLVSGFVKREFPMWGASLDAALEVSSELVVPVDGETLRLSCRDDREKRQAFTSLAARLANAHPDVILRASDRIAATCGFDIMAATDRAALTVEMIREMSSSGLVEFGAHSRTHARLSRLTDMEARLEISRSKSECEALVGEEIRHFAYPYGDANAAGAREAAICAELGFTSAVTTESNTLFPADAARPFALPRLTFNGAFPHDPQLELLLSGVLPGIRRQWHRWRAAREPRSPSADATA